MRIKFNFNSNHAKIANMSNMQRMLRAAVHDLHGRQRGEGQVPIWTTWTTICHFVEQILLWPSDPLKQLGSVIPDAMQHLCDHSLNGEASYANAMSILFIHIIFIFRVCARVHCLQVTNSHKSQVFPRLRRPFRQVKSSQSRLFNGIRPFAFPNLAVWKMDH